MNNVKCTDGDSIILVSYNKICNDGIRNQKNGSLNTKSIVYFIVRNII